MPRVEREATAGLASRAEPAIEPQVCSGCEPPLIYEGGPVMSTNAAPGLTVTPIFWEPSGGKYVFPSKYEDIIDGYIKNVAAASGSTDNVFSIPTEYYQVAGGVKTSITYAHPRRARPRRHGRVPGRNLHAGPRLQLLHHRLSATHRARPCHGQPEVGDHPGQLLPGLFPARG